MKSFDEGLAVSHLPSLPVHFDAFEVTQGSVQEGWDYLEISPVLTVTPQVRPSLSRLVTRTSSAFLGQWVTHVA